MVGPGLLKALQDPHRWSLSHSKGDSGSITDTLLYEKPNPTLRIETTTAVNPEKFRHLVLARGWKAMPVATWRLL